MIKKYNLFENIHKSIDPYDEEDWEEKRLPYEYETTLNIGNRINAPVYRNIYKVDIEHMHGDADAYTHDIHFVNENEALDMVNFCSWVNEKWVNRNKIGEVAKIVFGEGYDFIQYDATADHQFPARPRVVGITYFDNEGVEHRVNINKKKIK